MRRPLLVFLFFQSALILLIYYSVFPWISLDRKSLVISSVGEVCTVEGIVRQVQIKDYYTALVLDTGQEKCQIRYTETESEKDIYDLVGRKVLVQGMVSLPDARRNPNCFDYRLYLKGRGIYTIIKVSKYRLEAGEVKLPLTHLLSKQKGLFYEKLKEVLGDEDFSVLAGLMFGDKSYLDEDLYDEFQSNGTAHVLAVSGLHVGLMYALVLKLFRGKRGIVQSILTLFILYCYAALSGFSVSVLRASLMIALNIVSFHLNRRYDMVSAASLCAILFLLINPYQLFDSGFQLSFVAAYTMGVALPWAENRAVKYADKYRREWLYKLLSFCLPLIMIQLGMTPLTIFHFLNYSLLSVFINPLVIFIASLLLPCGLALFGLFCSPLRVLLSPAYIPSALLIKLLKFINSFAASLGLSRSLPALPLHWLLLYYGLFFYWFSDIRHVLNRRREERVLAAIAACFVLFFIFMPKGYKDAKVVFVDVGQGDCTHIQIGSLNILIDGGGSYMKNVGKETLKPYLLKNGVTEIDLAIVTHEDLDHSKGIYELAECFPVNQIYLAGKTNDDCGIIKMQLDGIAYLFMAEADIARENRLIEEGTDLSCDILKIAHHGSNNSTSPQFIRAVSPLFASISCGKNNSYGHPAPRVIALLENSGIIYGRTDLNGALCIKPEKDGSITIYNAAKDKIWHIQQDNRIQSTLPKPL